jgi:iron complex outermembrane receptor protein
VRSARVALSVAVALVAIEVPGQVGVDLPGIVVTGSRLPRPGDVDPAPVTTVTRDELIRAGVATAGEYFLTMPLNNGGAPNVNNGDGLTNPGYAAVSLRGIGANATLVLVNGRRIAPFALSGAAVDLNSIPVAAIDRVEILRDGASAIYGADAIAGVVNFILRSDYTGADVLVAGGGTTQGGARTLQATATAGGSAGAFNWFASFDYRDLAALGATQRGFSRTAYLPDKGLDYTSPIGFPGAYSFDLSSPFVSFSSAGLDCSATRYPGAIPVGDTCNYDYVVDSYTVPKSERSSAIARVSYDAGSGTELYAEVLLTRGEYTYKTSPTPVWGGFAPTGEPFVLPSASPYNPFGQDVQFWWRTAQIGPRTFEIDSFGDRVVGGVAWNAGRWSLDAAAGTTGNRARQYFRSGYVSDRKLREVLAAGGRVNPFGDTRPEDLPILQSIQVGGLARDADARISWADAKAVTSAGRFEGGVARLALGVEARRETLTDTSTDLLRSGDVLGMAATQPVVGGHRNAASAYAELVVPLDRGLDLQAGVRGDWTSDFGTAVTPRIAASWTPVNGLSLRASWARSFRAPNLPELYTEQVAGLTGPSNDPVRCPDGVPAPGANPQSDCDAQFGQIGGGNPGLQPERATHWLAGIVLQPVRNVSAGITYWHVDKSENVGILFDSTILDPLYYPSLSRFVIRREPSASDIANGLPGPIAAVLVNNQNLGNARYSGWDFEAAARIPGVLSGAVDLGVLAALITGFRQQLQPAGEYVDFLGQSINGTPVQRWRASAWGQWARGPWTLGFNATWIGRYRDENPAPDGTWPDVASWYTLGLHGSYAFAGFEARLGMQNVLNRAPPFSNKATAFTVGWDDLTHDPRGRYAYASLRYAFR